MGRNDSRAAEQRQQVAWGEPTEPRRVLVEPQVGVARRFRQLRFGGEAAKSKWRKTMAAQIPGAAAYSLKLATLTPGYLLTLLRSS